jgi:hypothetical protein
MSHRERHSHVGYVWETCFLIEVFFFRSSPFLVPHFLLDEWMNCSLVFFSASFALFARVLFFVHHLGLYTSIWLCHMKVWGGYEYLLIAWGLLTES